MKNKYDVVVMGAGFGGALMAAILRRSGLGVALVERGQHPRFALGESSTPTASAALARLASRYDLPALLPFVEYGSWLRDYPHVRRGLKRGFSYFQHTDHAPFVPSSDHGNFLMVAANPDTERADTHWLRSDFDHFITTLAQSVGVDYFDHANLIPAMANGQWVLEGKRLERDLTLSAEFLVDATGDGRATMQALGLRDTSSGMRTNTRVIYSHFEKVLTWQNLLCANGHDDVAVPFPCDAAALHHVFDGGWMWVLRFDHGVTSAGFNLNLDRFPASTGSGAESEWRDLLSRFPSINEQFANAELTMPMRALPRAQRRVSAAAGPNWAMLPTTAGIVDALFSTGNAHTLSGIERLATILIETRSSNRRETWLAEYSRALLAEISWMDTVVAGCYRTFSQFDFFTIFSMLYFVAATFTEKTGGWGKQREIPGFLLANDHDFQILTEQAYRRLGGLLEPGRFADAKDVEGFKKWLWSELEPYNHAGLCDDTKRNLYPFV